MLLIINGWLKDTYHVATAGGKIRCKETEKLDKINTLQDLATELQRLWNVNVILILLFLFQ